MWEGSPMMIHFIPEPHAPNDWACPQPYQYWNGTGCLPVIKLHPLDAHGRGISVPTRAAREREILGVETEVNRECEVTP